MSNTTPQNTTASPTPTKAAAETLPPVPAGEWPGAWGVYKYSRDAVKFNLGPILIVTLLIPIGVSILLAILKLPKALDNLISSVVGAVFSVASVFVILDAIRRKRTDVGTAVKKSFSLLALEAYGLQILSGLIIIASILCFIIPFFFIAPRISLALYYLVDKRLGILGSLSASWNETKGNVGKIYGIVGASIAMSLLALTIVGIPFAIYFLIMYTAALPILYLYIQKNPQAAKPAPAPVKQ